MPPYSLPTSLLCAALLGLSALTASRQASAQDLNQDAVSSVGVGTGVTFRSAAHSSDPATNLVSYEPAVALSFQARAHLLPWLWFTAYYQRAKHHIDVPPQGANLNYDELELGNALGFSLGARLEPTYQVLPRLAVRALIGGGWGRMTTPRMTVVSGPRRFTVQEREGVYVETPFGAGISFNVLPKYLVLWSEFTVAPCYMQSGNLFGKTQYVDNRGAIGHVSGFPEFGTVSTLLVGLSGVL